MSEENQTGGFGEQMEMDPEFIFFRTRASFLFSLFDILAISGLFYVLGAFLADYLENQRIFGYFLSPYTYPVFFTSIKFGAAGLAVLLRFPFFYKRLAIRYELSRRFIRQRTFVMVDLVETCDLNKVDDVSMVSLGPVGIIKLLTRDKSTPKITMIYLPINESREMFKFISSHAINSIPEFLASKSYSGGKKTGKFKQESTRPAAGISEPENER